MLQPVSSSYIVTSYGLDKHGAVPSILQDVFLLYNPSFMAIT